MTKIIFTNTMGVPEEYTPKPATASHTFFFFFFFDSYKLQFRQLKEYK